MGKKKDAVKVYHLFVNGDLVKSVLVGSPVTASCGYTKRFTREELDDEQKAHPACVACLNALGAERVGFRLLPQSGWLGRLEAAMLERIEAEKSAATITFSSTPWMKYTSDFPLAS